jgi:hypothetical protein
MHTLIAHHLILTGYGHWLPNDVRGSMSHEVHSPRLKDIAPLHYGRKSIQPSREELRSFHWVADVELHFPLLWWEAPARGAIADALGEVVTSEKLTCYACAVLRNHVHLLVRKHRMKAEEMLGALKETGRDRLIKVGLAPADHPVFSADSRHIYKNTPEEVRGCIGYIWDNYAKHRIAPIPTPWVTAYDGWPLHGKETAPSRKRMPGRSLQ